MKQVSLIGVAILATVCAMGCSKKGPECEQFVSTANAGVEKLTKAGNMAGDTPQQALAQSKEVQKIADETTGTFGKLAFTVPELQKLSTDYQGVLKDIATASKTTQDMVTSAEEVTKKAEKIPADMKTATDEFVKACGEDKDAEDSDGCKHLIEKLHGLKGDKAAEFTALAGDLDKAALKHAETKTVATKIAKVFHDLAKLMTDLDALGDKVKKASEQEDAAIKKQNAVIGEVNKFCSGS